LPSNTWSNQKPLTLCVDDWNAKEGFKNGYRKHMTINEKNESFSSLWKHV